MLDGDGRPHTGTMPRRSIRQTHLDEILDSARGLLVPNLLEVVARCEEPLIQAVFICTARALYLAGVPDG